MLQRNASSSSVDASVTRAQVSCSSGAEGGGGIGPARVPLSLLSSREEGPRANVRVPWWAVGSRLEDDKGRKPQPRREVAGKTPPRAEIKKIRLVWSDQHSHWRCAPS